MTRRLAERPLATALARRTRNAELADRVASAVVYEAGRAHISPSVLAARSPDRERAVRYQRGQQRGRHRLDAGHADARRKLSLSLG